MSARGGERAPQNDYGQADQFAGLGQQDRDTRGSRFNDARYGALKDVVFGGLPETS